MAHTWLLSNGSDIITFIKSLAIQKYYKWAGHNSEIIPKKVDHEGVKKFSSETLWVTLIDFGLIKLCTIPGMKPLSTSY